MTARDAIFLVVAAVALGGWLGFAERVRGLPSDRFHPSFEAGAAYALAAVVALLGLVYLGLRPSACT